MDNKWKNTDSLLWVLHVSASECLNAADSLVSHLYQHLSYLELLDEAPFLLRYYLISDQINKLHV